jgi:dihydropteroate synthase
MAIMSESELHPADHWKLKTRTLAFGRVPLLMGIVNVTPDSFSDGGKFLETDAAVKHGLQLAADGADILDIGGESTRPGAEPVDAEEELRRVMPVIESLCKQTDVPVSIDTSKAVVARSALDAGAEIINDVTSLTGDPAMLPLAVEMGCGVCAMHMQGTPSTMQDNPVYTDVVAEVIEFLRGRRDALLTAGIAQDRIALDPGIGFGKTTEHNLQLLGNIRRLHELTCPVLIGHSRKRFLSDRGASGTIEVAMTLARQRVQILRVHDVAAIRQALIAFQAVGGL